METVRISDIQKYLAELIGTFVLVFASVGTAVIAGERVGYLGIALAFGLSLLAMAYAVGPISGCHINPAVTAGFAVLGKIKPVVAAGYVLAQVIGGVAAAALLLLVANGLPSYDRDTSGLGANGFGAHSPSAVGTVDGYGLGSVIVVEIVLTALLVFVVLATTSKIGNAALAGIPIGLVLTLIHLVAIPIDGTSVNPARSLGPALFAGGGALGQLWAFIVFPLIGGVVGAAAYKGLFGSSAD